LSPETNDGVKFINIKFESIKNVEFEIGVVEKEDEDFKQEAIDIPFEVEEAREVAEPLRQVRVDVVPKHAAKRTSNGTIASSSSKPERKKSRLQIRSGPPTLISRSGGGVSPCPLLICDKVLCIKKDKEPLASKMLCF
jgi:hypothetical protein